VDALDVRLNSPQTEPLRPKPAANWIWAQVGTKTSFLDHPDLPKGLNKTQIKAWSKARHEDKLSEQLDTLKQTQDPGLKTKILTLDHQITELDLVIEAKEAEMNGIVAGLYGVEPNVHQI
jgi:hypothetical protein